MKEAPKPPSLAEQRQRLEQRIELQRKAIGAAVDEWHIATAPIDRGAEKIARFKRPAMIIGGYLTMRMFKRPSRLVRLTKRGVAFYLLSRNLRGLFK